MEVFGFPVDPLASPCASNSPEPCRRGVVHRGNATFSAPDDSETEDQRAGRCALMRLRESVLGSGNGSKRFGRKLVLFDAPWTAQEEAQRSARDSLEADAAKPCPFEAQRAEFLGSKCGTPRRYNMGEVAPKQRNSTGSESSGHGALEQQQQSGHVAMQETCASAYLPGRQARERGSFKEAWEPAQSKPCRLPGLVHTDDASSTGSGSALELLGFPPALLPGPRPRRQDSCPVFAVAAQAQSPDGEPSGVSPFLARARGAGSQKEIRMWQQRRTAVRQQTETAVELDRWPGLPKLRRSMVLKSRSVAPREGGAEPLLGQLRSAEAVPFCSDPVLAPRLGDISEEEGFGRAPRCFNETPVGFEDFGRIHSLLQEARALRTSSVESPHGLDAFLPRAYPPKPARPRSAALERLFRSVSVISPGSSPPRTKGQSQGTKGQSPVRMSANRRSTRRSDLQGLGARMLLDKTAAEFYRDMKLQ